MVAGAVGVSGGGETGVAVTGAGAFAQNKIASDVKAYVDGDGATRTASRPRASRSRRRLVDHPRARRGGLDRRRIGGSTGVAISIGLSIALNQVDNRVEATVEDATLTATSGGVTVAARPRRPRPSTAPS